MDIADPSHCWQIQSAIFVSARLHGLSQWLFTSLTYREIPISWYQYRQIDFKTKSSRPQYKWTTVIVRDSIVNSVIEDRINNRDKPVKVCTFPGATVTDVEHYLIPIIQTKPSNIILQVGLNDAKNLPSWTVLENLLKLKALVKDSLPTSRVFISTPTLRHNGGKAQITVSQLTKYLLQLKIDTLNNNNTNVRHLEDKKLTLELIRSKILSKHFLNAIEKFWKIERWHV